MAANTPQHPQQQSMPGGDTSARRHSADVGGLYFALRDDSNHGLGWLDSSTPSDPDIKISTKHAVLLSTMHAETLRLLENSVVQNDPPELSQEDRVRLLKSIESWYFEPLRMPEHQVLACVIFLFQVLFRIKGMQEAVNINFNIIPRFILHIRQLYRWQNHYHNFEHAVDVLQAIHCYLRAAGVVPPVSLLLLDVDAPNGSGMWSSTRQHDSEPLVTCLTPREIFALYLAAIGHDVAHPGFNNPFMENAEAPLSQVYENGSALEQMHSYMLLKTMRYHGLGVLLDDPESGQHFRRILRGSVLATDMGVHNDFMNKFANLLETSTDNPDLQAAKFERQEFVCKLLLKNADISNPSRPFLVSKQWASALQQEWACQYKYENYLELTHSVNPSNGPMAEANSQVFFTGKIAKPLVDMTAIAIPELRQYSYHCAENLREWERILQGLKEGRDSSSSTTTTSTATATATTTTTSATTVTSTTPPLAPPLSPPHPPSSTASSPRQSNTIITPNYPTFTSSLRSQTTTTATTNTTSATSPSQSQSQTPPISIPTPVSSPGATAPPTTTTTTTTTTSATTPLSSSSNPVSPRILNPTSDADYSGVFRLTRPKGSSSSTTSPSATPSSGFGMSGGSGGSGRAGQISRTSSNSNGAAGGGGGGGGGGNRDGASSVVAGAPEILPSLSRAAARVIAGTPSRTTGAGVVGVGGGSVSASGAPGAGVPTAGNAGLSRNEGGSGGGDGMGMTATLLWPSAVEPPKQFLPRSLMYPHPIKYVRQPFQQQQSQQQQQQQQEYPEVQHHHHQQQRSQSLSPPAVLPTSLPAVPLSNTPSSSSSPPFQTSSTADDYEVFGGGVLQGGIGTPGSDIEVWAGRGRVGNEDVDEDVVYEREVEMRHQGFRRAVERGIGVGSLKKRKSGNILVMANASPPSVPPLPSTTSGVTSGSGSSAAVTPPIVMGGGSVVQSPPPPPPGSATSVGGFDVGVPPPASSSTTATATGGYHHQSRASWCSGDSMNINLGTIEGWRGRWGAASSGGDLGGGGGGGGEGESRSAGGGKSRAVASSEEGESGREDDNDNNDEEGKGRQKVDDGDDDGIGEGGSLYSESAESKDEEEKGGEEGRGGGGGKEEGGEKKTSLVPAGLVSAAPIAQSSNPKTPPRQTGNGHSSHSTSSMTGTATMGTTEANRSGSPTPKAKTKLKMKMRESEAQRKKREEEEEAEEEERRRKLREELIRESEKEQEKKGSTSSGGGDGGGGGGKRSLAKSRSRSKLRRKSKGKK